MNKTGIVIILLCFLAAAAAVLWERRKIRKTMEEIERMLDAAMTGSFSENNFDESQLSALETKFAHYLSAAEASSRNVAQEKDKIKTLIADISHQTKTPIANLLLYSELLMEETLPASAKANVEALYKQSEKLRFLIDSLVKLSRLENGIISLSPQPTALQPLLESVVEQYTAKASEKGLSLQMQDTDAFAVFDFKWTAEALANIVDNAIKYTEHGTITISAVSYEMFARIDISDTGSGIPESEQAKIFARFTAQIVCRNKKGSASAYTLPDRSYPARAVISRLLPFREKEVRFPYFCRNNNNSIKTVRFHFPPERMWKDSYAIICMYQRIISFHTYRFFHGGTHLWKFYRQKT